MAFRTTDLVFSIEKSDKGDARLRVKGCEGRSAQFDFMREIACGGRTVEPGRVPLKPNGLEDLRSALADLEAQIRQLEERQGKDTE